jgi:ABC-2 type transport system ATP-binding protein
MNTVTNSAVDDFKDSAGPSGDAIEIDELMVRFGSRDILRSITARVAFGRITGLLGPSGAGKTTLMRVIVGVQRFTAGRVRVLGRPAGAPELRHAVGYVTQAPSVYADLTVTENLRYFARLVGVDQTRIDDILTLVDLRTQAHQLAGTLSGGELSRASLAIALLGKPKLLVLDEPTVGLDPLLRRSLWRTFHDLAADGVTLLVSTHVMDEADRCDDLMLLRDGQVLAAGTGVELRERAHAATIEDAFLTLAGATP